MTAWTDHLALEGAKLDTLSVSFADARSDAAALERGTVVVPLLHLGLIRSVGPDSTTFLHNLFSNDVAKLPADGAQWSSFNSPKGRMLASLLLWPEAEGHSLVMAADILPAMLKKLSMYVLRSKVKLNDAGETTVLIGVAGGDAAAVLQGAGLPVPAAPMQQVSAAAGRVVRVGEQAFVLAIDSAAASSVFTALVAAGAHKAGTAAWQLAMIRAGVPLITAPTQEEFVAQMLNYDLIGGVNFKKGCYPGQEIVARTQYLGTVKKRLYRVALDADSVPTPGSDLYAPDFGEQSAGKVVNVAPSPEGGYEALAVLQNTSVEGGQLRYGSPAGAPVRVLDLPYPLP
ncbi:YgfZ/GcvT domain-containing protein [Azoarcus olearius]|uniref:Conserved hypothetical aminomethyltransferase n=1 Tax=Azoarcus sp. (strain BH72) TaxID=418699 RepID=A1K5V5_AZOSB|nr:folate-binding protein YgfZ [Azoarcus olearius]CAL94210.1 conserved hypothetical aminomethyltransferase [Azoarcus olearius]